jgi:hypothetical protein
MSKLSHKTTAIALRKEGKSYSEILNIVPVAKSTLSLWLREVKLSSPQKQKLTAKKRAAQLRGAKARKEERVLRTQAIFDKALKRVGTLSKRELFLIGSALYWAEGSKERTRIGSSVVFGNMDAHMLYLFYRFLVVCLEVRPQDIYVSLYIHENHKHRLDEVSDFWKEALKLPDLVISHIYLKKHKPKTLRQNIDDSYHGTLRLRVQKSSHLLRMISGTIYAINVATCRFV